MLISTYLANYIRNDLIWAGHGIKLEYLCRLCLTVVTNILQFVKRSRLDVVDSWQ